MDIVKRLTLAAAEDPRSKLAQVALDAIAHIESLRTEIRTQRNEIAQHISVRNAVLDMDRPPEMNPHGIEDLK
jgi:hypothetical protein